MLNRLLSIHMLAILIILLDKLNAQCPAKSLNGYILSGNAANYVGRVTPSLDYGAVMLKENQDHLCYNHSLQYQMERAPEVAVSVEGFQIDPSNKWNFYIKPVKSENPSFIIFIIRLEWTYTKWTQLRFNFIAEDRTDIQSGYYLVDTASLSTCSFSKTLQLVLPYRTQLNFKQKITHYLFLHGFEITTIPASPNQSPSLTRTPQPIQYSPFQIQLQTSSISSSSGITINMLVTSATRVDFVYIGYVVVQSGGFKHEGGNYYFLYQTQGEVLRGFEPRGVIGKNYARIYGISGFLINYEEKVISFSANWDSFAFQFTVKQYSVSNIRYLTFNYLFFLGSQCDQCPGYPYQSSGFCVSSCPTNSILTTQNQCIECGPNRSWNGSTCIRSCPQSQILNPQKDICQCPVLTNWNGQYCITCQNNKIFNLQSKSCQCPVNTTWNGNFCGSTPICNDGRIWDVFTYKCLCPEGRYWNGSGCRQIPVCLRGQVLNVEYNCVCPDNFYWNGVVCNYSPCMGGQIWTGTSCTCPIGSNFNNSDCIYCYNGQFWNAQLLRCQCQAGFKWNGEFCQRNSLCQIARFWNSTYEKCMCSQGTFWTGSYCVPNLKCQRQQYFDITLNKCTCMFPSKWNGTNCVICTNGKIWNPMFLKCQCPSGTKQNGQTCQLQRNCQKNKAWAPLINQCICMTGMIQYNGTCVRDFCLNGRIINLQFRQCQCINNNIYQNNTCVPPQLTCINGRVWNPLIYACQCPPGTYSNVTKCQQLLKCANGKIYNAFINECRCPNGLQQEYGKCVVPDCGVGKYYNGFKCQVVGCPPPAYFSGNRCVVGRKSQNCGFSEYWNGERCVYYASLCPFGTIYRNYRCLPMGSCIYGQYFINGSCTPIPQLCNPLTTWTGTSCRGPNNICPNGTYLNNNNCLPYKLCQSSNKLVWNPIQAKCVCQQGAFSNGIACIQCLGGKVWTSMLGCVCPDGMFEENGECSAYGQGKCERMRNTFWINGKCLCRPGYTKVSGKCVCQGIQINDLCDRCSFKPDSEWVNEQRLCRCKKDYIQIQGVCYFQSSRVIRGTDRMSMCQLSTYFNFNIQMCLPCPVGCLTCNNSYRCQLCKPQFLYDFHSSTCVEICGDGKKFVNECDDANNVDGDGCSRDCKLEEGYQCTGGTPESSDRCLLFLPRQAKIQLLGQIRQPTSIIIIISLNHLPKSLLLSPQCADNCNILTTKILSGEKNPRSISTKFIGGTKYKFFITIQYGKPYIQSFDVEIGINQTQALKFYKKIDTSFLLKFQVNPGQLMLIQTKDRIE